MLCASSDRCEAAPRCEAAGVGGGAPFETPSGYGPPGKGSPTAPWDGMKTPVPWPAAACCCACGRQTGHRKGQGQNSGYFWDQA